MKRRVQIAIVATAALSRLFNLGSFSLWLDEILGQLMARGSLGQVCAASKTDAVHPPLANILGWLMQKVGLSDNVQRLLPIACGVMTVIALARWVTRHFGPRAGTIAGFLAALSPFGVRYSQELRPYSYLLMFVVLTLVALDRLIDRPDGRAVLLLSLVLAGGLYSHYFFALMAIPGAALLVHRCVCGAPGTAAACKRLVAGTFAAGCLAMLAYIPWLETLVAVESRPQSGGSASLDFNFVATRWQFLTLGTREGEPLTWGAVVLLVVVGLGAFEGMRTASGRVVASGALAGTAGAELLLRAAGHWSNARYDLIGWPFLVVLTALGLERLVKPLPERLRTAAAVVPLCVGAVVPLAAYDQRGRQHWDTVASTVRALHRPGEPVFVENEWTRISLGYYLFGPGLVPAPTEGFPFVSAANGIPALAAVWPKEACALFVTGGIPALPAVRAALRRFPRLAEFHFTDETAVVLLTPQKRHILFEEGVREVGDGNAGPTACVTELRVLPPDLRLGEAGRLDKLAFQWRRWERRARCNPRRLEFNRLCAEQLLVLGWSGWERTSQGEDFVWAVGRTAVLALPGDAGSPQVIRMRVWPMLDNAGRQTITASLNERQVATVDLQPGPQIVTFEPGPDLWVAGENLLRLDFAHCRAPHDTDSSNGDTRPLAVAFNWLELAR